MARRHPMYRATCDQHNRHHAGCRACQHRSAERGRIRTRLQAYGQWEGLTDTTAAANHARTLNQTHGLSGNRIADLAGVARTCVHRLLAGTLPEAHTATVKAILDVTPDQSPTDPGQRAGGRPTPSGTHV